MKFFRQTSIIIALVLSMAPAHAQQHDPDYMDAAEFSAFVTGNTIYYSTSQGLEAGAEAYHPNNRVTWINAGGICQKGSWYQQGAEICFEYEGQTQPICWHFYLDQGNLYALAELGDNPWVATAITTDPISCISPFLAS